jgi:hypothetical protein
MNPQLAAKLDQWSPLRNEKESYYSDWINYDLLFYTAIGSGFLSLRDNKHLSNPDKVSEKSLEKLDGTFTEGMHYGFEVALKDLDKNYKKSFKQITKK